MALAYTKEFLVNAYLSRYLKVAADLPALQRMAEVLYDREGRDRFRVFASLDAEALKIYRLTLKG